MLAMLIIFLLSFITLSSIYSSLYFIKSLNPSMSSSNIKTLTSHTLSW